MEYLVTPTLLNRFDFWQSARGQWKEKALSDIQHTVKRKKKEFPAWVSKGQEFEDAVYKFVNKGRLDAGSKVFNKVCSEVNGGLFQASTKFKYTCAGSNFVMFGRIDVLFPDRVIDIKTTINFTGARKYLDGWQAPLYCLSADKSDFTFLVVEWESETNFVPVALHKVDYTLTDKENILQRLYARSTDLLQFMIYHNLFEDYTFTYSKNRR